jgi:putative resolvase
MRADAGSDCAYFSCRLYGMRKYRKQIKDDYPGTKEPKEILE